MQYVNIQHCKKVIGFVGLVSFLFFSNSAIAAPKKKNEKASVMEEGPECKAKLLIDSNGEVLFEENAHTPLAPASMVKLMTSYVTLRQIKGGMAKLEDVITATGAASKVGGSQVYLKQGEQFTLQQLLEALLIQSANDAASAIAEHIGGSVLGFVELMNQEAKSLGMSESQFFTPHGLPPSTEQQPDVVSAHDFGILSRALIREFPEVLEITGRDSADFRGGEFKMTNHNKLLKTFPGCDGLKTGYYGQAGFSVTATAEKNGLRMVAVVMGCKERKKRDAEAARLLSQGFAQHKLVKLIDKGVPVEAAAIVEGGEVASISPVASAEFKAYVRSGLEEEVEKKVELCKLTAPVKPDTACGFVTFLAKGKELGKISLVVPQAIPAISYRGRLKRILGM